jgi:hypothetical protein
VRRREWLHFYWLSLLNAFLTLLGRRVDGFLAYTKKEVPTPVQAARLVYA